MFNKKRTLLRLLVLFLIFFAVSFAAFFQSKQHLDEDFLESAGNGVQDLASFMASNITLSDADVARLKKLSYQELKADPLNRQLQDMAAKTRYSTPIQYIYIMTRLAPAEVRYRVDKKNASFFKAAEGTPLEVSWLLDIYLQELFPIPEAHSNADLYRYSVLTPTVRSILEKRTATFSIIQDEWGKVLAGYAPVYTKEGTFVGMLGIDMSLEAYLANTNSSFNQLLFLFFVTNGSLVLLAFFFYARYLRIKEKEIYQDPLTRAYNRRFFDDYFLEKIKSGSKIKTGILLMMIDVDHFKEINDSYGHDKGDECLQKIADTLFESIMTEHPCLLIRYGGEEFLVGIGMTPQASPEVVLERILRNVHALHPFSDTQIVTVSIGAHLFSVHEANQNTIQTIIKKTDQNLYTAKNSGRNRYFLTRDPAYPPHED